MSDLKTVRNAASVHDFLASVENGKRREDSFAVLELMRELTGEEPAMWGDSLVGFGAYHYKGASGREGDWPISAFSPRKQNLTIYVMAGFGRYPDLMAKLGKYRTGSSCLYLNRLSDADPVVLRELIVRSVDHMRNTYG